MVGGNILLNGLDRCPAPTECHSRMVAYEYGLRLQPARAPLRAAFDALKLHTSCGVSPPSALPASAKAQQQASRARSATAGLSVTAESCVQREGAAA